MFEDLTAEKIKAEILSQISDLDTREGSYLDNLISPVSYELWKYYMQLNAMLPIMFVDDTSGQYIDKRAAEYAIYRKPGEKATVTMTFTGTDGTVIPEGKAFLTESGLQFTTTKSVTIFGGTAKVLAEAELPGEAYNVREGEITLQLQPLYGLQSFTNTAGAGGMDQESDESLVSRLYDYLQKKPTSGNVNHYLMWAKETPGVGNAKVFPLWNGNGTVKVVIVDQENNPAGEDVVEACQQHIEAERPIGAQVTVVSAQKLVVNVETTVEMEETTDTQTVQRQLTQALADYFETVAFQKTELVYHRIAYMVLDIPGVVDFTSMTLNGGTENIPVGDEQILTVGTVVVHSAD